MRSARRRSQCSTSTGVVPLLHHLNRLPLRPKRGRELSLCNECGHPDSLIIIVGSNTDFDTYWQHPDAIVNQIVDDQDFSWKHYYYHIINRATKLWNSD